MLLNWFSSPLKMAPPPVVAVMVGVILNLYFKRYPELKERLRELEGKIFQFEVEDIGQSYFMTVELSGEVQVHTYADEPPHVTMAGDMSAFLALLFNTTDPDSLFFSRRLKLSGETDTGLQFKNLLDNAEIDWERELSTVMGGPAARTVLAMAEKAREAGEKSGEWLTDGVEQWMDDQQIPRKKRINKFREAAEEVADRVERLEGRISRVSKKLNLSQATPVSEDEPAADGPSVDSSATSSEA
ncbi:MAG: SCP2 sterol-binding domain-containing protein [Magnetococcales bacterium]|nr:SCP2 sterol-binding domain-containing protein [Magnetococcales bacterium]